MAYVQIGSNGQIHTENFGRYQIDGFLYGDNSNPVETSKVCREIFSALRKKGFETQTVYDGVNGQNGKIFIDKEINIEELKTLLSDVFEKEQFPSYDPGDVIEAMISEGFDKNPEAAIRGNKVFRVGIKDYVAPKRPHR